MTRKTTEQMNSDIFDGIERENYNVSSFSEIELKQARESFFYDGYSTFLNDGVLTVKKRK